MSSEPQPTDEPQDKFTHLDIGGGTDKGSYQELLSSTDPELASIENDSLLRTRAVQLARNDPDGNYLVFDPNFLESMAAVVTSQVPNVHFVRGLVSADQGLPFLDRSFNEIEVNHLFYPLLSSRHLASSEQAIDAKVAQRKADIIQQATGMINHSIVEQQADEYRQELIAEIGKIAPKLEAEGTRQDFADYVAVLQESSRALKTGGKLILGEKKERMDAIIRMLEEDNDGLLRSLGMIVKDLKENRDPDQSAYAKGAAKSAEISLQEGNEEQANKSIPMLLTLQKL